MGMPGALGYGGTHATFPLLGLSPTDGCKGICPQVTSAAQFSFSITRFSPIEFSGNSTTCSTPNKFSTWTMADPLPGMDIRLLSVLLWSLKEHPPSSPLNSRALDLFCLPSALLSFSHTFPWPGYCLGGGPLYLITGGGVDVPEKAMRWSLDQQGGQAGDRFELLGTLNVVSLQTDTVTQSLSCALLWEHFSQGNHSFPQASNFAAVTRPPDPSPTFLFSSRR